MNLKSPTLSILAVLLICPCRPAWSQSALEEDWSFSLGGRIWYAGWDRDEDISRSVIGGNNNPPNQPNGSPNNPAREDAGSEADPKPFYSIYADAIKGDWRLSLATGFSGEYEFRSGRSSDTFERMDIQLLAARSFADYFSASLGLHYIDNEGSTEGTGRNLRGQDFSYSFTGPEISLGAAWPVFQSDDWATAIAASGTFGYYMVDDTTGFDSTIDDTAGYTGDIGLVTLWRDMEIKLGYRILHINDSIWSIDRITEVNGGFERERVETSETFDGMYLEIGYSF